MVVYEFKCETCGTFLKKLKMTSPQDELQYQECPKCGKKSRRIYGKTAIHFVGSGFTKTSV